MNSQNKSFLPKALKDEIINVAKREGIEISFKEVKNLIPLALCRRIENNKFEILVEKSSNKARYNELKYVLFHELGHAVFLKNHAYLENKKWRQENMLKFYNKNKDFFGGFLICHEAVEIFLEIYQEMFADRFAIEHCKNPSLLFDSEDEKALKELISKPRRTFFKNLIVGKAKKWDCITFVKSIAAWARFFTICKHFPEKYGCKEIISLYPNKLKRCFIGIEKTINSNSDILEAMEKTKVYLRDLLKYIFDTAKCNGEEMIKEFYARRFKEEEKQKYIKTNNNLVFLILQDWFGIKM